jgi:hypothetical protein
MDRVLQQREASQRDLVFNAERRILRQDGGTACRTQRKIAYCIYQETGILADTKYQFLTHLICLPLKRQVQHKQYNTQPKVPHLMRKF